MAVAERERWRRALRGAGRERRWRRADMETLGVSRRSRWWTAGKGGRSSVDVEEVEVGKDEDKKAESSSPGKSTKARTLRFGNDASAPRKTLVSTCNNPDNSRTSRFRQSPAPPAVAECAKSEKLPSEPRQNANRLKSKHLPTNSRFST